MSAGCVVELAIARAHLRGAPPCIVLGSKARARGFPGVPRRAATQHGTLLDCPVCLAGVLAEEDPKNRELMAKQENGLQQLVRGCCAGKRESAAKSAHTFIMRTRL